jgi:hypothetical protein
VKKLTLWRWASVPTLCAFTLAVATPAWADDTGAPAAGASADKPAAEAPAAPAAEQVTVKVRSTGAVVTVARVTDRMIAASGYAVVRGVAWKDLCNSPCTFKLDPGLHEIMVYGDGVTSVTKKFDLKGGEQNFVVKPGSSLLSTGGAWLAAFGILTVVIGGMFLFLFTTETKYRCDIDNSCPEEEVESTTHKLALPFLIGGAVGTGAGIWMTTAGNTSIEPEGAATAFQRPTNVQRNAFGLKYSGTW